MIERWPSSRKPREIVILLFDGVQSLDVTGPLEVFSAAGRVLGSREAGPATRRGRGYKITTLSSDGAPLRTSSGLEIVPDGSFADAPATARHADRPGRRRLARGGDG